MFRCAVRVHEIIYEVSVDTAIHSDIQTNSTDFCSLKNYSVFGMAWHFLLLAKRVDAFSMH